jgi:hypothetical protein
MIRRVEISPEIAHRFFKHLGAFHAERDPIKAGAIAARQLQALRQYQGLKFEFGDVKVPVKFTEASASWGTLASPEGDVEGRTIPLQWNFEVNPKHIAHLCFKPPKTQSKDADRGIKGKLPNRLDAACQA